MQNEPAPQPVHPLGEETIQILDILNVCLRGETPSIDVYIRIFDRLKIQSLVVSTAHSMVGVDLSIALVNKEMKAYLPVWYNAQGFLSQKMVAEFAKNVDRDIKFIVDRAKAVTDRRFESGRLAVTDARSVARAVVRDYFVAALLKLSDGDRKAITDELAKIKQARQAATVAHAAALQEVNLLNTRVAAVFNAHVAEGKIAFQQTSEINAVATDRQKAYAREIYYATLAQAETRRKGYEVAYVKAISGLKTENGEYAAQIRRLEQASDAISALSAAVVALSEQYQRRRGEPPRPVPGDDEFANLLARVEALVDMHRARRGGDAVRPFVDRLETVIRPHLDEYLAIILQLQGNLPVDAAPRKAEAARLAKLLDKELTEWFADMEPTVFLDVTQQALVRAAVEPLMGMKAGLARQVRIDVLDKGSEAQQIIAAMDASIAEMHIKFAKIRTWMARWRAAQLLEAPRVKHQRCTYVRPDGAADERAVQCGAVGDLCSAVLIEARRGRGNVSVTCCALHHETVEGKFRDNVVHEIMYEAGPGLFMWECRLKGVITN